jgi:hypothetical protein
LSGVNLKVWFGDTVYVEIQLEVLGGTVRRRQGKERDGRRGINLARKLELRGREEKGKL